MSPFADSQPQTKPSSLGRFTAQPALIVFLVCLLAGLGAICWKAQKDEKAARARARAEAQAHGAALELEINQAVSAAEVLGTLARQSGGAIPNFQRIATDLLATRPNLASLELQPGGIVSDIVPRPAQERALGRNLLTDPAHRPGLQAALQRRGLTVTGPTTLYRGEKGLVVRVPVLQRTRDNRESVWGFVAVSLRLTDAVTRAGLDQLATHGYAYHLFAPAAGQQPAVSIAAHGEVSSAAEQQTIRAQNLELCVALQPQGGWWHKPKLALEILGVLAVSGLLCLLVNLLESRNDMEGALTEANQRLTREMADRKQAQEDARALKDSAAAAQTDLKQTRFALQQAEGKLAESAAQREAAQRASQEATQVAQGRLQQAELTITELQTRLDTALHDAEQAGKARQAELAQVRAALQQALAANQELQARIEAADQAHQAEAQLAESQAPQEAALRETQQAHQAALARLQEAELKVAELQTQLDTAQAEAQRAAHSREVELTQAQAALQQAQTANQDLQARLETAERMQQENAAAAQSRRKHDQATIDELQVRLETTARAASEAAEVSATRLKEWEESKRALEARLLAAEQAAAQAAQLATPVEAPQTEALPDHAVSTEPEAPAPATAASSAPEEAQPEMAQTAPTPVESAAPSEPATVEPESVAPMAGPSEVLSKSVAEEPLTSVTAEASVPAANGEPASATAPLPILSSEGVPPTVLASTEAPVEVPPPAAPEPPAQEQPAKVPKRKKSRKVNQMDLFGGQAPAAPAPVTSPAETPAHQPVVEPLGLPLLDLPAPTQPAAPAPAAPTEPLTPAEPAKVAEAAQEQVPAELEAPIPSEPTPQLAEPTLSELSEPTHAQPTAPPVSVPELPTIEGLNTAEGLTRAEGNPQQYLKALRHFAEHQANIPAQIRDALVQGDSAKAEQLIQTLKTAAAEVGAGAIVQAADTLGRAVHEQSDPSGIEFLWAELDNGLGDLISDLKFQLKPKEDKPTPARPLPPAPPVNPAQLRKALHQILPLLADGDPGAKDCLKDNRATFRSAFTPEAYVEFEQLVKSAEFELALEHLKKAARKHGVSL